MAIHKFLDGSGPQMTERPGQLLISSNTQLGRKPAAIRAELRPTFQDHVELFAKFCLAIAGVAEKQRPSTIMLIDKLRRTSPQRNQQSTHLGFVGSLLPRLGFWVGRQGCRGTLGCRPVRPNHLHLISRRVNSMPGCAVAAYT